MSLDNVPNELLVKIFQKCRQLDIYSIKLVNKRFYNLVQRFHIELPIAKILEIHGTPHLGGWKPTIEIHAVVPAASGYQEIHKSIVIRKGEKPTEKPYTQVVKTILELGIGGCEELKYNYLTFGFDYLFIFDALGFDKSKLTAVNRAHLFDNDSIQDDIHLPFINDKWLNNINQEKSNRISIINTKTAISAEGIVEFIKKLVYSNGKGMFGHFSIGTIVMSQYDHQLLDSFHRTHLKDMNVIRDAGMYSIKIGKTKVDWIYNDFKQ